MKQGEEQYLKHDFIERFLHWGNVLCIFLLILSGMQIHFAGFTVFGAMNTARYVHFITMYFFLFLGIAELYQFFMLKKYKVSMFLPKDIKGVIPMIKYYLLMTDEEPEFEKYNPLQKIAYGGTFAMAIVMVVTGFALYWPVALAPVVKLFGGLGYVRLIHYLFNWFFIVFLMIHIYLVFAEDLRKSFIPMITGYAPKQGHK